ncbi:hypothetical protein MNV49_004830 [Pseudohyphozyma bogoriensis]|nr:hypothetical protein MNV49_004830 [Pseudohyphozyma bogoriensis]
MPTILPPEIWSLVISLADLDQRRRDALSCTRVSRLFYHLAIVQLYKTVHLTASGERRQMLLDAWDDKSDQLLRTLMVKPLLATFTKTLSLDLSGTPSTFANQRECVRCLFEFFPKLQGLKLAGFEEKNYLYFCEALQDLKPSFLQTYDVIGVDQSTKNRAPPPSVQQNDQGTIYGYSSALVLLLDALIKGETFVPVAPEDAADAWASWADFGMKGWRRVKGGVVVVLPTSAHGCGVGWLQQELGYAVEDAGGQRRCMTWTSGSRCSLTGELEPDMLCIPETSFAPTFVAEVAVTHKGDDAKGRISAMLKEGHGLKGGLVMDVFSDNETNDLHILVTTKKVTLAGTPRTIKEFLITPHSFPPISFPSFLIFPSDYPIAKDITLPVEAVEGLFNKIKGAWEVDQVSLAEMQQNAKDMKAAIGVAEKAQQKRGTQS